MSLSTWSAFCTLGSLVEAKCAVGHAAGASAVCAGVAGTAAVCARPDTASRTKKLNIARLRMGLGVVTDSCTALSDCKHILVIVARASPSPVSGMRTKSCNEIARNPAPREQQWSLVDPPTTFD